MKITKKQLKQIIKEEASHLFELGIDRRASPLAIDVADVILAYDLDQRESLESYGLDVQMLKDLLDEVKNIVLPELDRRATSMDRNPPDEDWPGGI